MDQLGIVDTSVVISFLRGVDPGAEHFRTLLSKDRVVFSSISVFELRLGESPTQETDLDTLFEVVRVVSLNAEIASQAADVYHRLEKSGKRIGLRDTFIGATAIVEGLPVYTQNSDHFDRIENLKVFPVS